MKSFLDVRLKPKTKIPIIAPYVLYPTPSNLIHFGDKDKIVKTIKHGKQNTKRVFKRTKSVI